METKKKRKGCRLTMLITGVIALVVLVAAGGIGWTLLSREHEEAANVPLDLADFSHLQDGTFTGEYEGGMYKWRASTCRLTVKDGKVVSIELLESDDPGQENTDVKILYDRVVSAQSLQVDTISGASLTSKAYLAAVQDALLDAQQ